MGERHLAMKQIADAPAPVTAVVGVVPWHLHGTKLETVATKYIEVRFVGAPALVGQRSTTPGLGDAEDGS
jgi:hypothetical protein